MSDDKRDALWDTPLPPEEFERRLGDVVARMDGPEGEEMMELHRWFMHRYPTPLDRLRYIRKQTASVLRAKRMPAQ